MHQQIRFILYFFALVFIFSCGSDDDELAGTYRITSFTSSNCADPIENFDFDFSADDGCTTLLGEEVCGDGTLTLGEDGSFRYDLTVTAVGQSFGYSGSGSYTVDGNTITICDADECETSTFTLGSGTITIRFSEADDPCILTLRGEKT